MAETVTLKTIMAFFGMSPAQMTKEWKALTDKDKADIKSGLENGSLTYQKGIGPVPERGSGLSHVYQSH